MCVCACARVCICVTLHCVGRVLWWAGFGDHGDEWHSSPSRPVVLIGSAWRLIGLSSSLYTSWPSVGTLTPRFACCIPSPPALAPPSLPCPSPSLARCGWLYEWWYGRVIHNCGSTPPDNVNKKFDVGGICVIHEYSSTLLHTMMWELMLFMAIVLPF